MSKKNTEEKKKAYSRTDPSPTRVELSFTVPGDEYADRYKKELKKLGEKVKIKGFRPGKAPEKMVEVEHGSDARQATLEGLINDRASQAIAEEEISPVMSPSVEVADVTDDNEVTFIVRVPVIPDISLPDIKKVDVELDVVTVEDSEVDEVLKKIWQDHRGTHKDKSDEWVKEIAPKLGFQVETVDDLKKQIKEAIRTEKERIASESFAQKALMQAIEKSNIEVPEELIEYEAHQREHSFLDRLEQMKITKEAFCEQQGVTMEQLEEQWKKDAKEAVDTDIFLATYARERDVKVEPEELESEVEMLKKQSQDPDNTLFDNEQWRGYIERVLLKRKAYAAFLTEVRDSKNAPSGTPKKGTSKKKS